MTSSTRADDLSFDENIFLLIELSANTTNQSISHNVELFLEAQS